MITSYKFLYAIISVEKFFPTPVSLSHSSSRFSRELVKMKLEEGIGKPGQGSLSRMYRPHSGRYGLYMYKFGPYNSGVDKGPTMT